MTAALALLLAFPAAFAADPPPAPAAPPAAGAPETVTELVRRIEARYAGVDSLVGAFVQTTKSPIYGEEKQSGTLSLVRPNRLRWQFSETAPGRNDGKLFVADGETLWVWSPAENQVVRSRQVQGAGGADVLLDTLAHLSARFAVTVATADAGGHRLSLVPLAADDAYVRYEVTLSPALDLQRLVLVDAAGTSTTLDFGTVALGAKVDPAQLTFQPPAGAEIVDL